MEHLEAMGMCWANLGGIWGSKTTIERGGRVRREGKRSSEIRSEKPFWVPSVLLEDVLLSKL